MLALITCYVYRRSQSRIRTYHLRLVNTTEIKMGWLVDNVLTGYKRLNLSRGFLWRTNRK